MTIREKKRRKRVFTFIVVIILLMFFCFYYYSFVKDSDVENSVNNLNKSINYEKISKEELETIVANELYILNNKKNISEITNSEKLLFARTLYLNDDNQNMFTPKDLETYFNKTCLSYLGLKHENFLYEDGIGYIYEYNEETDTYSEKSKNYGHGARSIGIIYSNAIEFKNEDNRYIISYDYLFSYFSEGETNYKIYGSYEDALNNTNYLGTINYSDDFNKTVEEFYDNNYSSIEEKLKIYSYTFEKVDGKIQLVDFSVK